MIIINDIVKNPLTDYGIKVKTKLFEIGRNQNWLIGQVKEKTDLFLDTSLLNKVMTGRSNSPRIIAAIDEILELNQ